jgi:hypothetical protein
MDQTFLVVQGPKPKDYLRKGEKEGLEFDYEDKINFAVFPSLQVSLPQLPMKPTPCCAVVCGCILQKLLCSCCRQL